MDYLEALCSRVIPEEQQGFLKGGRIFASYLALYSLIENARMRGQRLFVGYVDVKKAFPSVRRDLLFKKLSELGASDSLVRAVWALYEGACASVRTLDGYGHQFDIQVGTREGGVESPLLYILFVSDLIGYLGEVCLFDEPVLLDGRPVRALQLADDLALVATSASDLQRLLDQWGRYCDREHKETQVRKTKVVVYTSAEDARRCHAVEGELKLPVRVGSRLYRLVTFTYKDAQVQVVDAFTYLGIFLASSLDASAVWHAREEAGCKAFGAVKTALWGAPFLPFHRTLEVCTSTTGGTYLYSAELWGPFLPSSGSSLNDLFSRWMLGFWRTRADRRIGWVNIDNLDDKAVSRAVRVVGDALLHKGLLFRAVRQLCLNWEAAAPRQRASCTWVGLLTKRVKRTWPQFRISAGEGGTLVVDGAPLGEGDSPSRLAVLYYDLVRTNKWVDRQISILRSRPSDSQQDFVIYNILAARMGADFNVDNSNALRDNCCSSVIFRIKPTVSTNMFRTLLRFLAGLEDFARINAHYARRDKYPVLSNPVFKRSCLSCLLRRNINITDSEWHCLFECPCTAGPRALFNHVFAIERFSSSPHSVLGIVALTIAAGDNINLTNEFARWVVGSLACRKREFSALIP